MINRRDFFRRGMQLAILGGLIGGTAYIVSRNGVSNNCAPNQACGNCSKLNKCKLDKAEKYKENDREKTK